MTLTMNMTQADLTAALQAWVASTSGGSSQGVSHEMNATVPPIFTANGGVTVQLNF
jgi:hypothetical protein